MDKIPAQSRSIKSLGKIIDNFSSNRKMQKYLKQFNIQQWMLHMRSLANQEREELLLYLLSNPAHELREESIKYIIATDEKWVLAMLANAYWHGGKQAKLESIKILRKKQDPESVDFLLEALKDKEWKIKRHAALALGQIGAYKAIPLVASLLKSKDWRLRRGACDALRKFHDPEALPVLYSVLNDRDWRVRRGAVRASAELDYMREKAEDIIARLQDRDWRVRILAAELLVSYPQPQAWEALINALDDLAIASVAAKSLTTFASPVVPDLINALLDTRKNVAKGAAEILGNLEAVEALPALEKAALHKEYDIRQQAQIAIRKIAAKAN
ncbi:MAG: HEAT repeat domain-containing protein [Syntrophomonadaceae bacterium]|nr:HEAT repeat domain-containing protein [Syntrophomonadaceae bacterium]MDD3022975.1 HEAT repeat domain-containing protein [Syntrophomonadaceae bacterium]